MVSGGTGLDKFGRRFPKRTFDVGIAEQHAVTFAAGMVVEGLKPFVCLYSTFMQRAYDQVRVSCRSNFSIWMRSVWLILSGGKFYRHRKHVIGA